MKKKINLIIALLVKSGGGRRAAIVRGIVEWLVRDKECLPIGIYGFHGMENIVNVLGMAAWQEGKTFSDGSGGCRLVPEMMGGEAIRGEVEKG